MVASGFFFMNFDNPLTLISFKACAYEDSRRLVHLVNLFCLSTQEGHRLTINGI